MCYILCWGRANSKRLEQNEMKTLLLLLITIFLLFEQSGCGQTDSTNEYYSNQRKLAEEQEKKNEEWAKKHSTKEDTEKVFKVFNDRPDIVYYLHIPYSFDPPKSTSNKDEITPNSINNPFDTLDLHLDLTLDRTKKIHKIQFRTYAKNTVITVNDSTYLSKIKNKLKTFLKEIHI